MLFFRVVSVVIVVLISSSSFNDARSLLFFSSCKSCCCVENKRLTDGCRDDNLSLGLFRVVSFSWLFAASWELFYGAGRSG